jgi:hypothetical protein
MIFISSIVQFSASKITLNTELFYIRSWAVIFHGSGCSAARVKITLHQKLKSYFFHSSMLNKQHGLKITLHQKLMGYFSLHVVQRSAAWIKKYFTSKAEELFF